MKDLSLRIERFVVAAYTWQSNTGMQYNSDKDNSLCTFIAYGSTNFWFNRNDIWEVCSRQNIKYLDTNKIKNCRYACTRLDELIISLLAYVWQSLRP